jgi:hypothetical protein
VQDRAAQYWESKARRGICKSKRRRSIGDEPIVFQRCKTSHRPAPRNWHSGTGLLFTMTREGGGPRGGAGIRTAGGGVSARRIAQLGAAATSGFGLVSTVRRLHLALLAREGSNRGVSSTSRSQGDEVRWSLVRMAVQSDRRHFEAVRTGGRRRGRWFHSGRIGNLLINSLARRITHRLQVSYSESTGFRSVGAWIAPDPKASSSGASR